MTVRRVPGALATALALAVTAALLLAPPTPALAAGVQQAAPAAVSAKNARRLASGKAVKVKMAGKTRTVKYVSVCVSKGTYDDDDACGHWEERLYVDAKKVLARDSWYDSQIASFSLAKVTSSETLVYVSVFSFIGQNEASLYRFDGNKLVGTGFSLKQTQFTKKELSDVSLAAAGSGEVRLTWSKWGENFGTWTYRYAKHRLTAKATPRPTRIATGKTVKVDLNGGKKESVALVRKKKSGGDSWYYVYQVKVAGKVLVTRRGFAWGDAPWRLYWADFNKKDKWRELLLCRDPTDYSPTRCELFRYQSGKLVEAKYKARYTFYDYQEEAYTTRPGYLPDGGRVELVGDGTFTATYVSGSYQGTKSIALKLKSRFEIVKA